MAAWSIPNLLYRSVTAGVRPPSLQAGQLFINQADGVLCWPGASNVVMSTSLNEQTGMNIAPATPAVGYVSSGYMSLAKREMLAMKGSASTLTPLQPLLGYSRIAQWLSPGNSASLTASDATAFTVGGTATARSVASTNALNRIRRTGYISTASIGAFSSLWQSTANWLIGSGSAPSGFLAQFTFGTSDATTLSVARQFVGMTSSVATPGNVEPSTLTNVIAIGHGAADTNLMLYCAGSSTQTPINLGANFPANTLSADMYRFTIWAAVDGSINWQVDRIGTAFTATGTFANATPGTTAPANTTLLGPRLWRTNNNTPQAVSLDVAAVTIMTDGI